MSMGGIEPRKPSQVRESNGILAVCMGPSGSGKTSLLETLLPDYGPLAVVDIDGKAHVLRDLDDLHIFKVTKWSQVDAFTQDLEKAGKHPPYNTVCYDGTTLLQLVSHEGTNVYGTDNPQLRMSRYGEANRNMVQLASRCRTLTERGLNIIFNIWSWSEKEDESDAYKKILPDLTPTLQNRFIGQLDFVVYLECDAPPHAYPPVMRTGGSAKYGTKTAVSPDSPLRDIPDKIYNPSWKSIFDSFHGQPWNQDLHKKG